MLHREAPVDQEYILRALLLMLFSLSKMFVLNFLLELGLCLFLCFIALVTDLVGYVDRTRAG